MSERTRLCECGCGEPIPLAKINRAKDGLVKGQQSPARFLNGHYLRVHHPSWWKGDDVGYRSLHTYLSKHYPKTGICDECGKVARTDYALIKGREHSRDRADYRELCRKCHMVYDRLGVKRGPYKKRKVLYQAWIRKCFSIQTIRGQIQDTERRRACSCPVSRNSAGMWSSPA